MKILGIETSCDETAAAIVEDGRTVLSNAIYSQIAKHRPYGGVVPEIASRNHVAKLPGIIEEALAEAGESFDSIDAIACTYGPGLASSLLIGFAAAKTLAQRLGKPLIGVNHHEGHLHSVFMKDDAPAEDEVFPMLGLMVSGGDSSLVLMQGPGQYELLGSTIDDAAGEALDKAAAVLGLGYPGGPIIQKTAEGGNPKAIRFPRGLEQSDRGKWVYKYDRDLCFSFSGLKTSLLTHVKNLDHTPEGDELCNIAASYQEAVCDALVIRVERALGRFPIKSFCCAGGVSLNKVLREKLTALSAKTVVPLLLCPPAYCTDNAAMIAGVACEKARLGKLGAEPNDVNPNLRLADWV
ncbi:tRNA (adenosine(37)-N6)-threonylcarbamoyltransferase complex transferase subunit TsaD [Pontiella sulfatireligans]|uniref:tRNA N6-adenosine threonylcarbamoyltransferase n=1 Tax=Pontiella sulfatireligans TaxID=2750658 RepID=A0A6C2UNM7_9BACT|nr:tRNA (adenosine(37)-N6)-threonylcarbamoyltransferase complex transferase subunit TsaD [Pontiella sulfatireligans]VGO20881.1 tRNA N6-adenosine threonylcarbamoyltransferase [Pontiella sulfatireligans]